MHKVFYASSTSIFTRRLVSPFPFILSSVFILHCFTSITHSSITFSLTIIRLFSFSSYTQRYKFAIPFNLKGYKGYDRCDSFIFDYEPNGNLCGSFIYLSVELQSPLSTANPNLDCICHFLGCFPSAQLPQKNEERKIAYYIISRLEATAVQKGRFGRPKIQLSPKVAKWAGLIEIDFFCAILSFWDMIDFIYIFLRDMRNLKNYYFSGRGEKLFFWAQSTMIWRGLREALNWSPIMPRYVYTEKTCIPFAIKLNEIWSWWQFPFDSEHKWKFIWFRKS